MTSHTKAAIAGLAVAVLWGLFADIPNKEYGWFIGRLILVPLLAYALSVVGSKYNAR